MANNRLMTNERHQKWRNLLKSDLTIFIAIYCVGLLVTILFAIFKQVIISDQAREYELYLLMIKTGQWQWITDLTINSCLTVTLVPAYIQRLTGIDPGLVFKVFPCVFYSLVPAFVYLISRKYLGKSFSVLTSFLVLTNFYFLYYPAIGRVGVAWGCMAGLMWGLISKKYFIGLIFGIILVFSHYGTTFIALGLIGCLWLYYVIRHSFNMDFRRLTMVLGVVLALTVAWDVMIAKEPWKYAKGFVEGSVSSTLGALPQTQIPDNQPKVSQPQNSTIKDVEDNSNNFYSLESREPVIQEAFGKMWPYMDPPQKIEFFLSWLIVILLSLGLALCVWKKIFTPEHTLLALLAYFLILLTLAIPFLSIYYGIARVYFTALILLAPAFTLGIREVTEKLRVHGEFIISSILIPYGMCVSGIMHRFWGIVK